MKIILFITITFISIQIKAKSYSDCNNLSNEDDLQTCYDDVYNDQLNPISITIKSDGSLYIQDSLVEVENLISYLNTITDNNLKAYIYLRVNETITLRKFMEIFNLLSFDEYKNIFLSFGNISVQISEENVQTTFNIASQQVLTKDLKDVKYDKASNKTDKASNKTKDSEKRENTTISRSEIDLLVKQLSSCYKASYDEKMPRGTWVKISVKVRQNKEVVKNSIRIVDTSISKNTSVYGSITERAMRIFLNPKCIPLKLPEGKWNLWKNLTIKIALDDYKTKKEYESINETFSSCLNSVFTACFDVIEDLNYSQRNQILSELRATEELSEDEEYLRLKLRQIQWDIDKSIENEKEFLGSAGCMQAQHNITGQWGWVCP